MASSSSGSGGPGFKLDIGCVERDEDRGEFLSACSRLDVRAVHDLVDKKRVDVDSLDAVGQGPFHFIALAANAKDAGGSGDAPDDRQVQLIDYLTSLGGDVNRARTTDGWTPLMLAAVFNRANVVNMLLSYGADASITDGQGRTAEDWAARYGMDEVRDILVHSRCKVPHSRFSLVQQSPAPTPPADAPVKETTGGKVEEGTRDSVEEEDSSTSASLELSQPVDSKNEGEAPLLTAQ